MVRYFEKGIDEIARIDTQGNYSFVSIGRENIEKGIGFAVRSFQVSTALLCQKFLQEYTGNTWRIGKCEE